MLEYIGEEADRMGVPMVANLCDSAVVSPDLFAEANGSATTDRESLSENASNVFALTCRRDADAKE